MEQFKQNIRSETIKLYPATDNMALTGTTLAYIFYKNTEGSDDFMPRDLLETSFYQALEYYPAFAGTMTRSGYGTVQVVVDRDNLNMPTYADVQDDTTHFSDAERANFHWDSFPKGGEAYDLLMHPGEDGIMRLASIRVTRMAENSGLLISGILSHAIVDGLGAVTFLMLWSSLCRRLRSPEPESIPLPNPIYDRRIVANIFAQGSSQLPADEMAYFAKPNWAANFLAWASPNLRGTLHNYVNKSTSDEVQIFYFSKESLDRLREMVSEHVDKSQRLSSNNIITGLFRKCYASATLAYRQKQGMLSRLTTAAYRFLGLTSPSVDEQTMLMFADLRFRFGIPKNYTGNAVLVTPQVDSMHSLATPVTGESLARAVLRNRQDVDKHDKEYCGAMVDMYNAKPEATLRITTELVGDPSTFVITDQSRFPLFGVDFGNGNPVEFKGSRKMLSNMVFLSPAPPPKNGINVIISAIPEIIRELRANESWAEFCETVY
ncbi:hypothetical protein GQ54DRAFT_296207 [Martensiomyces pterosporus]|nr:hypothetical protein GQ54DRAFT_296207 [Martensiomyces pterosporus]